MSSSGEDPSNFLTNPPQTCVKVINTSREEMNGQLGIAVGYQNGRYLVHNVVTQQAISLKPENLVKASMMESAKAKFLQLKNDARFKRQIKDYYEKAKQRLHPVKPEYAVVAALGAWIALVYFVGFTKTVMVSSVVFMLGVLVAPDVMSGASMQTVLQNLPSRSRETMEETLPFLKGRLSNRIAMGIVVLMVVMAGQSMFMGRSTTRKPKSPTAPMVPPHTTLNTKALQDKYYKLGYEDARNGMDYGASLVETATTRSLDQDDFSFADTAAYDMSSPPPPHQRKASFGYGTAMSAFYLYRIVMELGTDVGGGGGGFSFERAVANARTLEWWKMGMVAFSLYNLVRSFI